MNTVSTHRDFSQDHGTSGSTWDFAK